MELLTLKEACVVFKMSRMTLYRRMQEGLPYIQFTPRGQILFDRKKVEAWIGKHSFPYEGLVKRRYNKSNRTSDKSEYLTKKACAELFGISTRTLDGWLDLGLPYIRLTEGGKILFDKAKVIQWIDNIPYEYGYHGIIRNLREIKEKAKNLKQFL